MIGGECNCERKQTHHLDLASSGHLFRGSAVTGHNRSFELMIGLGFLLCTICTEFNSIVCVIVSASRRDATRTATSRVRLPAVGTAFPSDSHDLLPVSCPPLAPKSLGKNGWRTTTKVPFENSGSATTALRHDRHRMKLHSVAHKLFSKTALAEARASISSERPCCRASKL